MTDKVNALGVPAPNRTDFKNWSRENLEAFARQAADENLVLQANNKALHEAWRQVLVESVRWTFNPGPCAGAQEDLLSHP